MSLSRIAETGEDVPVRVPRPPPVGSRIREIDADYNVCRGLARDFGDHADAPRPDVILLDLNLPGVDGRTIVAKIKEDPSLKMIPVAVPTSSEAESDIVKSHESLANCFIAKPINVDRFSHGIRSVESLLFEVVALP